MKREQLQHFIDVVAAGSINKAAEKLYITQPSLSRSIKSLEDEMGKELLQRTSHGISLTSTGKIFYNYAQSIIGQFNMLERLKEFDQNEIYTQLTVSVDSIFLKDDIIFRFYKKMKSLETEIRLIETTAEAVLNNVSDGTSEVGITVLNDYQLKIFKRLAEVKELELELLGSGPLYIHFHKNSSLAQYEYIPAEELLSYIQLHLPYDFFSNLNRSLDVDNVHLSDLKKTITMSNYHAVLKMMQNTDSFLLGHKWQIDELKASHVLSKELCNSHIIKHFIILKRKKEGLSQAAKTFLELIRKDYQNM